MQLLFLQGFKFILNINIGSSACDSFTILACINSISLLRTYLYIYLSSSSVRYGSLIALRFLFQKSLMSFEYARSCTAAVSNFKIWMQFFEEKCNQKAILCAMCSEHYERWKINFYDGRSRGRSHLAARSSNPKIKLHRWNEFAGFVYYEILIKRFCIF